MIQYDIVIGNPPFSGSLHIDIIESVIPFMSGRAKGCFIQPSTWLINVRKNGKAKKYDELKKKIEGHIKSIDIENLNQGFGTLLRMPFSITEIDMSKTYKDIDFTCCGEHKNVDSLYDCNMIGDYKTIWSILEKVKSYGDMMKDHITNKDMGDEYWYAKFEEKNMLPLCEMETDRVGKSYENSSNNFIKTKNGEFYSKYFTTAIHYIDQEPSSSPLRRRDRGKHITDIIDWNVYGTENEIKNWKHFIFNNKLPLFINIVITISQDNPNKEYLPWLVDKQYTDEEINEKFRFTKDEIKLIDETLKKFERHSHWFKRYICGKKDFINISG